MSGEVSILTALVAYDAGVSSSVRQCLVSIKYSTDGALTRDAVHIYYDYLFL